MVRFKKQAAIEDFDLRQFTINCQKRNYFLIVENPDFDDGIMFLRINFEAFTKFLKEIGIKPPKEPDCYELVFSEWFDKTLLRSCPFPPAKWGNSETEKLFQIANRLGYYIDISTMMIRKGGENEKERV